MLLLASSVCGLFKWAQVYGREPASLQVDLLGLTRLYALAWAGDAGRQGAPRGPLADGSAVVRSPDRNEASWSFCHLSKCVLKAEFLRPYGTKQNAVDVGNGKTLHISIQDRINCPEIHC
jgi:hypothetical protein